MKSDYRRTLSLLCPTCAGPEFEFDSEENEATRTYSCRGCGLKFSHDEIMISNRARIDAEVENIKSEVLGDVQQKLRDVFKGMKGWKVK
jgi:hypothetical protein